MEETYNIAIENFSSANITSSCALFMELLELNCEKIKIDTRTAVIISKYWNRRVSNERKYTVEQVKRLTGKTGGFNE